MFSRSLKTLFSRNFVDVAKRIKYADVFDAKPVSQNVNFIENESKLPTAMDGKRYYQKFVTDDEYLKWQGALTRNKKFRARVQKQILQSNQRGSRVPRIQRGENVLW